MATGPTTVNGINVTKAGPDVFVIEWNEAQNSASYEIEYRATGEAVWSNTTSNVTNTTLDNLQLATTYEVRVRGVSISELGRWSCIVIGTTCDGKCQHFNTFCLSLSLTLVYIVYSMYECKYYHYFVHLLCSPWNG